MAPIELGAQRTALEMDGELGALLVDIVRDLRGRAVEQRQLQRGVARRQLPDQPVHGLSLIHI